MNINASEITGIGSLGLAVGSGASSAFGWFETLNTYAGAAGSLTSIFFGCVGVYFMIKAAKKDNQTDLNKKQIDQIINRFDKLDVILIKLNKEQ